MFTKLIYNKYHSFFHNLKIICVIPARGGSKRLRKKNIYPLLNKPLINWSIEECLKSNYLNYENIYVSTEDDEIKKVAKCSNIKIIDRPKELSLDHIWKQDVLKHAKKYLKDININFEIMVSIQANSPQIKAAKIDECIDKLIQNNLWEVFTVDQDGIEDAAIHVLLNRCVDQKALSVYKGIVVTNYIDVHTIEDIQKIEKYLK